MVTVLDFVLLIIAIVMGTICVLLLIDEFGVFSFFFIFLIIPAFLSMIANLSMVIGG